MKKLLEQVATTIADYRAADLPAPDADDVGRWVAQFDETERKPLLEELLHVWNQIYVSKSEAERFLTNEINNQALAGSDPKAFWEGTEFLKIQERGHSQADMLRLMKPILKAETGLRLSACGGEGRFIYIDDVLFTGGRIKSDLSTWLTNEAPAASTVYVLLMAVHTFGEWRLGEDLKAKAKELGKTLDLKIFRLLSLENRKFKKDSSDVLWPTTLPPAGAMYAAGATGHTSRHPGGASSLFSSEAGRHNLEQAFLKAGLRIRAFSQNPKPVLRPLGYGPFGVGFGSLFVSWRNCPNNAPLALWWGDPESPNWHPFSKWRPLVPRKTYGGDDDL